MKLKFVFFCLSLFCMTAAWADMSISPFYILFNADSNKRTDIVRFTNNGNEEKTYRIKLINYKQLSDGRYEEINEPIAGSPFASPYINYAPHETTLQPRQSQTIRIQRKAMPAAADGEYVSHLLVQEVPDKIQPSKPSQTGELKIDIQAIYGVTIPVLIDKGDLTAKGVLKQARLITGNKPEVVAIVGRSGTMSFWGDLVVTDNGKEIGRVNGFKIFLTTPDRRLVIPLTQKPTGKIKLTLWNARTNEIIMEKTL